MKIPNVPFKAVCIKEFKPENSWGCLELLRIYEFLEFSEKGNLVTTVKVVGSKNDLIKGEYGYGFFVSPEKLRPGYKGTLPYFFDHFVIIK